MENLKTITFDKNLSSYEKFLHLFFAMNMKSLLGGNQMLDYLNKPQNALFHEKSIQMIIKNISPLLSKIIQEGIIEGIFSTDFPDETAEIILIIVSGFLDNTSLIENNEKFERRLSAMIYNIEKILGAQKGSFNKFKTLISEKKQGEDYEQKL